jgi:Tannase-like family of unknown function (DUF6351)
MADGILTASSRLALSLIVIVAGFTATAMAAPARIAIEVLSSSASRVTGGDALVEVTGAGPGLTLTVNGTDETNHLTRVGPAMRGVIDGLKLGDNLVMASAGGAKATLTLTNYPNSGPVFSGPHQSPFVCETAAVKLPDGNTLGTPKDADCWAPTNVQYLYKPNSGGPLKPYDPSGPKPDDLGRATLSTGAVVDYIVRLETGVINRAIYQISMLATPTDAPTLTSKSPGWNGVLVYSFGGGCGAAFRQGRNNGGVVNGGEMNNDPLDRGYAVASSTFNVQGQNCNDVISAETTMMVKERFIERFGAPRYTIGLGGSGGSWQQFLLTANYPGLLDGLLPERSYPDLITLLPAWADCPLLTHYFETTKTSWTPEQKAAATGYYSVEHCSKAAANYQPRWISPLGTGCDGAAFITAEEGGGQAGASSGGLSSALYDPVKNPKGTRCSYYDNSENIYGRYPDGRARSTYDNTGMQYGLKPFNEGKISFDQFLDLNRNIGGYDQDANFISARVQGDPQAIHAAYASGRVNDGQGMNSVPIIDVRSYVDQAGPDVHTRYTTDQEQARWSKAGPMGNYVALMTSTLGSLRQDTQGAESPLRKTMRDSLAAMDGWLAAIAKDPSNLPKAQKIVRNKPDGLSSACFTADMRKIALTKGGECDTLYPVYGDPRLAAGEPQARTTLKCALSPVATRFYTHKLSVDQLDKLKAAFPTGICDYAKPAMYAAPRAGTWLTYTGNGNFKVAAQ